MDKMEQIINALITHTHFTSIVGQIKGVQMMIPLVRGWNS